MTKEPTTIYSLLQEMRTWIPVSEADLAKAKESTIADTTNVKFRKLCTAWQGGVYDEDPGILVNELLYLLK